MHAIKILTHLLKQAANPYGGELKTTSGTDFGKLMSQANRIPGAQQALAAPAALTTPPPGPAPVRPVTPPQVQTPGAGYSNSR